ncbi:MAG: pyroglutamyl-peptidase I [Sandaracinaceae bacterium]
MSRAPTVLLTGFEPFGGETVNPSWLAVRALEGETVAGARIVARELPCVFGEARRALEGHLDAHAPSLVICAGQAGGRDAITLERVAINVDDARIPDNAGKQPIDEPVVRGGPAAYFTTLPIKAIVRALRAEGLPADVSQTAGTFVCNHVFYGLMHALAAREGVRGGFVHVPFLPEQAARAVPPGARLPPSLPLPAMIRALRLVVATSVVTTHDAKVTGGATH